MAVRFRKSIKIAPGIRLNISKSGISTSIGPRGATVNLRGGKRRVTVGIPGTGLSSTQDISKPERESSIGVWVLIAFVVFATWLLAGCGSLNTPGSLRNEPARLEEVVNAGLTTTFRNTAEMMRTCRTAIGRDLSITSSNVFADLYEREGLAEISQRIVTMAWSRTDLLIELRAIDAQRTHAKVWVVGALPTSSETWFRGVLNGTIKDC